MGSAGVVLIVFGLGTLVGVFVFAWLVAQIGSFMAAVFSVAVTMVSIVVTVVVFGVVAGVLVHVLAAPQPWA